ncbi:MAG: DNA polymerase III subunit beta, partial [Candidatus Omnitrophica bacterium]|nr:DNA polymerase III subunit beta [Candidatus Omnitrophota bacterium]
MKIKVNHKELLDGIQAIQNVVPTRATLPILSNFLFETQKDSVRIVATDLDLGVSKIIKAEVQEEGGTTIPARRFGEIIKETPQNEDITIQVKKNNSIHITCGACFFKLMGIPREEFPKIPKIEKKETLTLEQKELKKMLDLTSFAISHNETRYVLNGALFSLKDGTLSVVATDG